MKELTTSYLADEIGGKLIGEDILINGVFNILKDSKKGDAVIRHLIDENGVKIGHEREVSCIITQNISKEALSKAQELDMPVIISDKIENATGFALKWALEMYAKNTLRIVVTGTNGKSTTTHMLYTILNSAGYCTYTNTDSQSEYNTLIDPMVAKQLAGFNSEIEAMVIEVSEVQGWMDRIMKDHAHLMTSIINPQMVVLTNVALDHIGLVNSIEEAYEEIYGAIKDFKGKHIILNNEDPLIRKMGKSTPASAEVSYYGKGSNVEFRTGGIYWDDELIVPDIELPFKSPHFILDTLAAVQAALKLKVNPEQISRAISSYTPLERRFCKLSENPVIIDDFAHNPDGIKATIESSAGLTNDKIILVNAIRGSRGDIINRVNAEAVAEGLKGKKHHLIITSSTDVVNKANIVKKSEKNIFFKVMDDYNLDFNFFDKLVDALKYALKISKKSDVILLIGAQGMDPANKILKELIPEKMKIR